MNYYLYKMKFHTSLHIGDSESARSLETTILSMCGDTLFSALCHTSMDFQGEEGIQRLYTLSNAGKLLFSDAMPYKNDALYIPKPYITGKSKIALNVSAEDRKKMKKLTHIPILKIPNFFRSIEGMESLCIDEIDTDFGVDHIEVKVGLKGVDKPNPYNVGLFSFHNHEKDQCGLYFIIGYEKQDDLDYIGKLMKLLGISGIGGKTSAGYGRFEIEDEFYLDEGFDEQTEILINMLTNNEAKYFISMTTGLPKDDELEFAMERATYSLKRRGGYIRSYRYGDTPLKKQTQYFFSAGSVFAHKFSGDIYDVSYEGTHPVYRYAKPIFLGVNI